MSRTFSAATRVAEAVITVAREACAPMPCSIRSVLPWVTRILLMSAPSISAATCAITVSKPCPIEAPPVMTSISPRGVDLDADAVGRTEARLLDEHGEADADHLALVAARGQLAVELGPFDMVRA